MRRLTDLPKRGASGTTRQVSFSDGKTITKTLTGKKWHQQHPSHNKSDSCCCLTRCEEVMLFRIRRGHNRLNAHPFHKQKIGLSEMCPCDTAPLTTEDFLQHCPLHDGLTNAAWPENRALREKLFGDLAELKRTAAFVTATGVDI